MVKKFIILGVALLMLFSLAACEKDEEPQARIEKRLGIKLPEGMEIKYHYDWDYYMDGRGQYTVFKLKEEPTQFLDDNSFSELRRITDGSYCFSAPGNTPKEYCPDQESQYRYRRFKGGVRLEAGEAAYYPDTLRLIFKMYI